MHSLKKRLVVLAACAAVIGGSVGIGASPAQAEPILSASDVAAGISAPSSGGPTFPVTGSITNTGLFSQNAGSTLTISATNGAVTSAPGCSLAAGVATCTAGALSPGAGQSWTVTVAPNAGAASVTSTATAVAANGELNIFPDNANNTASAVTNVLYTVDAAISSAPSTVRAGDDTLLTATATNSAAPQNVTLSVNLGGKFDPALALPAGCAANGPGTVVTCMHAYATGQSRSFDIAVTTPTTGSSITSTATATGAGGGSDSASTVTNLYADATAFVPEGDCLSDVLPNHTSNFCVATGSAPGLFLDLNEATLPPGTMCGTSPCKSTAAEALFPNEGTYSGSDPAHPFLWDIGIGQLVCNGSGDPAQCAADATYYIPSGGTTPVKMPKCATYGQAVATLTNVDQVCLQKAVKSGKNWIIQIALLRDIVIPIIGGSSGAR